MNRPTVTANNLAEQLHEAVIGMEPLFEAARGVRAKLEADGWSPTAAEAVATEWLLMVLRGANA